MLNFFAKLLFNRPGPDVDAVRREGFSDGFSDGYAVGFVEGAKAGAELERGRIKPIFDLLPNPQHQTMLEAALWDGVSTAPDVAQRAIKAAQSRVAFIVKT